MKRFKKVILTISLLFCTLCLFAEEKNYDFNIFDGTLDSFTMNQMNENYLSVSRLVNRGFDQLFGDVKIGRSDLGTIINLSWPYFTYAITHEEGHRSILTAQGIGSISQPFFNSHGTAYVKGVTDKTLIDLRDSDRPSFVRMYTAGIESDYMMIQKSESMIAFGQDEWSFMYMDLILRRLSVAGYLQMVSMFDAAESGAGFYQWMCDTFYTLEEEENEYARDIAGLDPFGATKALFESKTFHRYTQYSDFTKEEKEFLLYRVSLRGFLNYLSPFMYFDKPVISIGENIGLTGSAGYIMAPFGDMIEEKIYFQYKNILAGNLNLTFYARQQENYNTWYPAFGLGLTELKPLEWLSFDAGLHLWYQPEGLAFYTTEGFFGGALEIKTRVMLPEQFADLTAGALWKSEGFMPGIEQHNQHFRLSLGVSLFF